MSKLRLSTQNLLLLTAICWVTCTACTEKVLQPEYVPEPEPDPSAYTAPLYPDNYAPLSSWEQRNAWGPYNLHDPSMEKDGDYFYVFGTQASYGGAAEGHGFIPYRRSKDLVNWEFVGHALNAEPEWVVGELNTLRVGEGREPIPVGAKYRYAFWAPSVHKVGNKFRLYYSTFIEDIPVMYPTAVRFDPNDPKSDWNSWSERSFIGYAEAEYLQGPWVDKGVVTSSVSNKSSTDATRTSPNDWNSYFDFNGIDPSFIIDQQNKHWLIFGSWHTGIVAIELDPATGKTINDRTQYASYKFIAKRTKGNSANRWQALEGPEIVYNSNTGFYYLFLAYDHVDPSYNNRVCRSATVDGIYSGSNGGNVTTGAEAYPVIMHPYRFAGHNGWQGTAHCAVNYDQTLDKWFYNSQGRFSTGKEGLLDGSPLMVQHIHEIVWTHGESSAELNGWPIVLPERYAAVPKTEITESAVVGNWEIIVNRSTGATFGKHNLSQRYSFASDLTIRKYVTALDNSVSLETDPSGTWAFDNANSVITATWSDGVIDRLYVQDALDWESTPRVRTLSFAGLTGIDGEGKKLYTIWGKRVK